MGVRPTNRSCTPAWNMHSEPELWVSTTQFVCGVNFHQCRAPPAAESDGFRLGPPPEDDDASAAAWDAYWGWDCCGPGGVCDRVYAHLGIAPASWTALKMLPAVRLSTLLMHPN